MAVTIDNRLLRKLERFKISPRGVYRGGQAGMRRSLSRGTGLEFADHKEYSVGDDIRYLDWMLYGRLEELFIKVFEQEESLPVYILLDCSASMLLGILSLIMWLCPLVGLGVAIPGLVLGNQSQKICPSGKAKAGVIMCIIGLVLTVLNIVIAIVINLGQL